MAPASPLTSLPTLSTLYLLTSLRAPLLPDCLADPNPDPNLADLPHGAHVQLPGARFPQAEPEPEPEP